jgi:hypothetical protein
MKLANLEDGTTATRNGKGPAIAPGLCLEDVEKETCAYARLWHERAEWDR